MTRLRGLSAGLLLLLPLVVPPRLRAWEGQAAELARLTREAGLDPEECYRVRDLNLAKEDLKLYLTDGYLIFGRPVAGQRFTAIFSGDVEGGDGELILFPPTRGERLSMASASGSPNLNEHFKFGILIFTDDTYEALIQQIKQQSKPRKSSERGALLSENWSPVLRNLSGSFEIRLVHDLLRKERASTGFFYAGLSGNRLGNIDLVYDPSSPEQIRVGKVATRGQHTYFEVWTSFSARSFRMGQRSLPPSAFQLGNFRLDATLRPDLTIQAVTKVTVTPAEAGLRAIDFGLSRRVRVQEAFIDGQPVEVFQRDSLRANLIRGRDDDVILLVSPAELHAGRQYEVEIRHEGAVITDAGNGVYFVGSRDNWYPNRYSQFANYDVTFHYPTGLDLVAAGEIVTDTTEGEQRVTRRKTNAPVRFVGFNLGSYRNARVTRGRYTVEVCANRTLEASLQPRARRMVVVPRSPGWAPPGQCSNVVVELPEPSTGPDPAARLQTLATEIAAAFEYMSEHFGPPPLRYLTVSPIPGAFGQGFPGLVYLSTISYLDPKQRPAELTNEFEEIFFSEILLAHETAHQWWGNIVTSASYRDDWVMEALANYSALLFMETRKGSRAAESVLAQYKKDLLRQGKDGKTIESMGPIVWGIRLETPDEPAAWQTITYEKGSWIMHMLRRRMGDERFLGMLGELRRRYEYKGLTTEQFRAHAAGYLPPGSVDAALDNFFEHWVYSTGIPTLDLQYTVSGKAPSVKLTGTLTQSGSSEEINVDVPVEVRVGGKTITRWLRSSNEPVGFTMSLKQKPQKVVLDPASSVLAVRK